MLRNEQAEVLVVGAGPVGMLTALLLAEAGIAVSVIDEESRQAARSYACALHARSLELLDRLGLAGELVAAGQRVDRLVFYEGPERRAEIHLSGLSSSFPFLLVIPQSALETALEKRLRQHAHVDVRWNHRLSSLREEPDGVIATVDRLVETARGYIVPTWDWVVDKTLQTRVAFLIGADGHNSYVRRALGIEYEGVSAPEAFEVYEFETEQPLPPQVAVVLDKASTNVLWPLPGQRCRWNFQLPSVQGTEHPTKERSGFVVLPAAPEELRRRLQRLLQERAPWFKGAVGALDWSSVVEFEHRLAKQFGRSRCWLAGDAAHLAGPVGMQSMNVGLREAQRLAEAVRRVLREGASIDTLAAYHQTSRAEWERLLGVSGRLRPGPKASAWARENAARLLACLPAGAEDIGPLAGQLQLEWA